MAGARTEEAVVEELASFDGTSQLSPFDGEKQVEVSFIDMDDAEAIDTIVASFFEDHSVDDCKPSGEHVIVANAIVQYGKDGRGDELLSVYE